MTIYEFVRKYNGKALDYDGAYGYQCVDLAKTYAKAIKHTVLKGNGIDWQKGAKDYKWIKNSLTNYPKPGDIVVWGTKVGRYGHVAINYKSNVFYFTSFDQNWPVGSRCHLQRHTYYGVLGWLRPL